MRKLKLNLDCIRAVMLISEECIRFEPVEDVLAQNRLSLDQVCTLLPDYSKEDLFYSIYNLEQAGYLIVSVLRTGGGAIYNCEIKDITYQGHEFLNHIRDDSQWKKVRSAANAVRDFSLSAIEAIAEGVTSAAISSYFSTH